MADLAAYRLEVDWEGDGLFTNAYSDVSADLLATPKAKRGRNYGSMVYGRSIAGELVCKLRNTDSNRYDRFNTNSPLHELVLPGRMVKLSMNPTPGTSTTFTTIWAGYLDSIKPIERRGGRDEVQLRALGILAELTQTIVSSSMQTNVTPGTAIGLVLTAGGVGTARRGTIATGLRTMSRWWARRQSALQSIRQIEESEGGFLFEEADGKISFDAEYSRLTNRTSVITVTDELRASTIPAEAIAPEDPVQDIANIIKVPVRQYTIATAAVLWALANTPALNAGESITFVAEYPTEDSPANHIAVDNWTAIAATTDYTAHANAAGTGTAYTTSLGVTTVDTVTSRTITVTNNHATLLLYLTLLQSRGQALVAAQPYTVEVRDQDSIDRFGARDYLTPAQFLNDPGDARGYGRFILQLQKDPLRKADVVINMNDDLQTAIDLDLSDRVTLEQRGVSQEMFVEAIEHRISAGLRHDMHLLLSPALPYGNVIVLDTGPGLGTGILGR